MKEPARGAAVEGEARALTVLDRVVHEPARLAILTILAAAEEVEFRFLEEATGLTKGNLSAHVGKLEAAGYVDVKKAFRGKVPVTSYRITRAGEAALRRYRETLFRVLAGKGEIPNSGRR